MAKKPATESTVHKGSPFMKSSLLLIKTVNVPIINF